jgi:photosystem II stability/assembly factor-like uncharacterized protein
MPISKTALSFLALPLLVTASVASASPVDPPLYQQLQWRSVGPYRGGRVLAVAGDPTDARRFYFGSVNGGVWRTDDAGRTWTPIFDEENVGSIGAIAIAPSDAKVIYVGTGEADMRSDIAQGIGMFRSGDGGKTWQSIGLSDTQQIGRIVVDPRNPDVVLVAALGHPYGPNPQRGVFRSTDGGRHWTRTLYRDDDTGAIDLKFEPGNPSVVYAAMWQTRRPPWNTYPPSYGPGSGLYKSTDGGRSWHQLSGHGLPANPSRIGIATSPARPHRVYALIDSSDADQGGLYRSDDSGGTWRKVSGDKRIFNRGWYFGEVDANPKNADQVWVSDTIILRSDDGGAHFIPLKGDPTGDDFHSMWIDPKDPDRRILGVDQGTLVTLNGGKTWSSWYNQPTGQFYHVSTDNRYPYRIYGAQQDSGAAAVPSRTDSQFDGITMTDFHEVTAGGESNEIAPDPQDPDIVYGGRDFVEVGHRDSVELAVGPARPQVGPGARRRPDACLPRQLSRDLDASADLVEARAFFVLREPADLAHGQWRADLEPDQPRPHAAGARGSRQCRPGDGQGQLDDRPAPRRRLRHRPLRIAGRLDLGRDRRWADLAHRRRGRTLGQCHSRAADALVKGRNHRAVALRSEQRLRGDRPSPAGGPEPAHPAHARRRTELAGDRQRAAELGRAEFSQRGARGHHSARPSVRRDRARPVRFVRRRRQLAAAAERAANHIRPRHHDPRRRPGDRDAWPRLLRARRHYGAALARRGSGRRDPALPDRDRGPGQ